MFIRVTRTHSRKGQPAPGRQAGRPGLLGTFACLDQPPAARGTGNDITSPRTDNLKSALATIQGGRRGRSSRPAPPGHLQRKGHRSRKGSEPVDAHYM